MITTNFFAVKENYRLRGLVRTRGFAEGWGANEEDGSRDGAEGLANSVVRVPSISLTIGG
jgi:hypothetical protein